MATGAVSGTYHSVTIVITGVFCRQRKWIPWMGIMIPWLQGELRVAARTAQDLRHVDFTMLVRSLRRWGFRILVGEDTEYRVRIKV